jgi:peroxiredoxin (alkyl hydroperoxide reductase subunit C)
MGADVVTVSTDTKFVHLAWQQNERQFGVYDEDTGLTLRDTFIINPDGNLINAQPHQC